MNPKPQGQAHHRRGGEVPLPRARGRGALIVMILAALSAPVVLAATRTPAPAARATPPEGSGVAATVGPMSIALAELDQRTTQALADYHSRSGSDVPAELRPAVKRQMLERLIQRDLLALEAARQHITATDLEAEAVVRKDPYFSEGGVFNEAKYLSVKNGNPVQFHNALEQAKLSIATRRLTERVAGPAHVDEKALRARAARGLEQASFDYLALRRVEFIGTVGEPREDEILAYYRAHAAEFRRPDRALVSILWVQQELGGAVVRTPDGLRAWEQGIRQRADSLLKAVQGCARLEDVGRQFGGLKSNVVLLPGNFPSNWRGDDALNRSVFEQRPGTVLPTLVPSNPGWLIVRVDEVVRAHTAGLIESAREIRSRMRQERRDHTQDRELHALYPARLDSLRGTGYRVRYAALDTAMVTPGEPSAADLDRFYRGHLADYSSFNNQTGSVESQPFAQVRDNVRMRWLGDRRNEMVRVQGERLADLWARGQRESKSELAGSRVTVREAGPVALGVPVDSGAAAALVTDSLSAREGALGVGSARYASGMVVFDIYARVPNYAPTFEQARPALIAWLAARQERLDEQGARALFDRDPTAFAIGKTLRWTSLLVEIPDFMKMTMTHREVEEFQRRHLDRYSAPEAVHASHILISPADATPAADARAHARADSLLERVRRGENFARLARENSDDLATRDQGGDLGDFGRGAMLPEFERAAFALRPGEVSGLVRSEVGYHIIRCHDYLPSFVQPLVLSYSNVSSDLAMEKADSASARRADSLYRAIRTPAQARAAAKQGFLLQSFARAIGEGTGGDMVLDAYIRKLETLKPGQLYPGMYYEKGSGYMLSWVDSVTAPQAPSWDAARTAAIDVYRRSASARAVEAKRAELDSMMTAGWSFDSLATLWGGLEHAQDASLATKLPYLGTRDLDSLVFGTRVPAQLTIGQISDWVVFPAGIARLRVVERAQPNPAQLAARIEGERRREEARRLEEFFLGLKQRFQVRIVDAEMRNVDLPTVPDQPGP